MDHAQAQEQFSDFADGSLPEREKAALEQHLAACIQCRTELESFRRALGSLGKLKQSAPAGLLPSIHEQIYKWRQVIAARHQLPFVKQEAMRLAGKVMANPKLYRAAVETAGAGIEHLPRFMLYSGFNAWGRQREVPSAPAQTFRQWYLKNRVER